MKVLTYNMHKGRDRKRNNVVVDLAEAIAERQPDLLLCQEVFHGRTRDEEQCHRIAHAAGHDHVFGPNKFYPSGCHGNATFTHLPIEEHVNIDATESFFEKRGILHAVLHYADAPLDVLNVHFSLTGRQRRRQWFKLAQAMPDDPAMRVIAAGDFNDWRGNLDKRVRQSGLLENSLWALHRRERRTFPARRPLFALDRIYVRGFRVVRVE
ncbi:MAG: endonuclease/exonuclease/phosphatase family protein, partial [Planctomycetes bacterium]|nr:endonuclease/exonuclease/phosphatase family protein [Planctomycetota bacterium]